MRLYLVTMTATARDKRDRTGPASWGHQWVVPAIHTLEATDKARRYYFDDEDGKASQAVWVFSWTAAEIEDGIFQLERIR